MRIIKPGKLSVSAASPKPENTTPSTPTNTRPSWRVFAQGLMGILQQLEYGGSAGGVLDIPSPTQQHGRRAHD